MNKDKILAKAKQEKTDERERQVETTSFRYGWMGVTIMLLVLLGFRWYANESSADLILILMAQVSVASFYQYQKLENKMYLVAGVMAIAAIILGFFSLLSQYGVY